MTLKSLLRAITDTQLISSRIADLFGHLRNKIADDPYARAYRQIHRYTMSGDIRLRALYSAVQDLALRQVEGDVVECGTARGGSAALLGLAIADSGHCRGLWCFDTFEGIPPPTARDPDYDLAVEYTGKLRGELGEVRGLLERLGIADSAHLIKGRFQDTLPVAEVNAIALLHVDGDWYESVRVCLECLYDRVTPGGIIQIDDYGHWRGARKAVDEFLRDRGISERLRRIDYTGRQFIKPTSHS